MIKTKLVFPPFWICASPYLSVPSLAAYMGKYGLDVEQVDLNLEVADKMLSKDFLSACLEKYLSNPNNKQEFFSEVGEYICNGVEEHKHRLRSEKALNIDVYEKCRNFMALAFSAINITFPNEKVDFYFYQSCYNRASFESILQSAEDAYNGKKDILANMLISYFVEDIVKNADLIGISLTGLDQIIPSFVLAGLIKKKNPNIKIVLGGSIPTRWFSSKEAAPDIFAYIDYVIVNEGEAPLVSLVHYLEGKIPVEEVPQLIYLNENRAITYNHLPVTNVEMCLLPTPVFNKKDLNRYLSPIPTLPLLTSRGCYWGKCTFCDHSFVYNHSFRQATIEKIIEDITIYMNEYGVRHINFHDEAMTPKGISVLSEELLHREIDIRWSTDARLDKGLTHNILQKAKKAGLAVLFFGFESINQRIVSLMEKGTRVDVIQQILSDTASLGIASHLFFICGFPTETIDEYKQTVKFIQAHCKIIANHGSSIFTLGRNSPIAHNPEKFSVKILNTADRDNASLNFDFIRLGGNESDDLIRKELWNAANTKIPTYAREIFQILFREHWIIFWDGIHGHINHKRSQIKRQALRTDLFVINQSGYLLIFDARTSNVYKFDKSAKIILDLIIEYGCKEFGIISSKASDYFSIPKEDAERDIAAFIDLLISKGLVCDPVSGTLLQINNT